VVPVVPVVPVVAAPALSFRDWVVWPAGQCFTNCPKTFPTTTRQQRQRGAPHAADGYKRVARHHTHVTNKKYVRPVSRSLSGAPLKIFTNDPFQQKWQQGVKPPPYLFHLRGYWSTIC